MGFIRVILLVWTIHVHVQARPCFSLVHVVDAVLHYTLGFAKLQCIPKKTVVYYD